MGLCSEDTPSLAYERLAMQQPHACSQCEDNISFMMVLGGYTDVPPILTSPTPMQEGVNLSPTHHHAIQSLEKEFILVKHHLKQLVLKKARRLREIHRHKRHKSGYSSEQCTIVKLHWKCSSQGSFYYRSDPTVDKLSGISLFSSLPNEVLLHIFSYLGVTHLCKSLMHVCALFSVIALDESLWRPLYHQHWGFHMPRITEKDGTVSWRYRFTQQSLTESNWWRGCYNVHTLEGHKGAVRCMQYSGDMLVTGSADKTIKVWSLSSKQCTQELHDTKWIRCLRFDAPSSTLVTTGMDSTQAKVWNLTDGTVSHVLDVHRGWLTSLQLAMPRLVTGSLDGTIRVWDVSTGSTQPNIVVHSGHDSLRSLWLSGDLLMSAGVERNLQLWDLRTRLSPPRPSLIVEGAAHGNYCVQFDLNSHVAVSGSNGTVAMADLRAPSTAPLFLRGHTDVVSCLQIMGKKLVTGSMDRTIKVWDLTTRECPTTLHGHGSWIWDLQLDHDKVVSASGDNVVKMWAFNPTE